MAVEVECDGDLFLFGPFGVDGHACIGQAGEFGPIFGEPAAEVIVRVCGLGQGDGSIDRLDRCGSVLIEGGSLGECAVAVEVECDGDGFEHQIKLCFSELGIGIRACNGRCCLIGRRNIFTKIGG